MLASAIVGFFVSMPALATGITPNCNVYGQDRSGRYFRSVVEVANLKIEDQAVFVSSDTLSGFRISMKELEERKIANRFKDLDGGTVVIFQQNVAGRFALIGVRIDSRLKYEEMDNSFAVGGISRKNGLGLFLNSKKIWANCSIRQTE